MCTDGRLHACPRRPFDTRYADKELKVKTKRNKYRC